MIFTKLLTMLKKLQKNLLVINFLFLFFFICSNSIASEHIIVSGNQNITIDKIKSLAPEGMLSSTPSKVNEYQKKLFDTGFFNKVNIEIKNEKIFIKVEENPLVNFFYIEGLKGKELNDKIYDFIKIKENTIFQNFQIKSDIIDISNYLKKLGYLKNEVTYKLIKIADNKINIFYNIKLNNKFKINRIYFIGNKFFKSSVLKDVIASSEAGWWNFLSASITPSEELINYDISRLKSFYLNNGFYDVQINAASIKIVDERSANIIYSINSSNKYKISKINLIDNSKNLKKSEIEFLEKKYNNFINNYYDKSEIDKFSNFIDDYLSNLNYDVLTSYNSTKVGLDKIILSFFISDIINKKIVNKITIKGNSITDDFVIRNSILFSEGDILNKSKLEKSIEKLKGKNLFKTVNSKIEDSNKEGNIDLEIQVEEKPTGEIAAGAGAGTNGATISGSLNEKNFLGKGISLNSNINIGTQKIFGRLSYTDPDFNNSGNSFSASAYAISNDFKNAAYENKVIGSSASFNYEIYDKLFINPGLSVDFDSVSAKPEASQLVKKRDGDYFTSKLFYNLSKNTKNRDFQTTDGYLFGVGQGFSILSDIPYINNRIFGSFYEEYKSNFVGSIKYKIESINGIGEDIKLSDRLFVNSDNLRGFANNGVGPKLDGDYIGGNYSFYTNFSSTFPNGLPEKWNALTNLFFDVANVWGVDDGSAKDSSKIRSSVGLGVSWISPIGPISFTYAEPLTKSDTDKEEQFNFKIGSAF